ncbi:MAG: hypothetical protein Q7T86_03340 [Hyphomicrobiaceae bacterium]|nr:hypothetical protein [Hyphomicrobiaceae bacterium]
MTDIIERLDQLDRYSENDNNLFHEAAETIRSLREALEPFAEVGRHMKFTPGKRDAAVVYTAVEMDGLNSSGKSTLKVSNFHGAREILERLK